MTHNCNWHYLYSGLQVTSEIEIPEWAIYQSAESFIEPDVHIYLDDTITPTGLDDHHPVITLDEVRFTIEETGTYAIRQGREILLNPRSNVDARELRLFALGTAWGALCYQRGLLIIHASVVSVDGCAVAFCGLAGAGKSALAAGLVEAGHLLVGDDLCRFAVDDQGQALVYPSAPRIKLWDDTLNYFRWNDRILERDHFRTEKYHLDWQDAQTTGRLPLRAFYLLEWGELNIVQLAGLESLRKLIETATYRGSFLKSMGLLPTYWAQCMQMIQVTPVYQLSSPRDLSMLPEVIELLEKHW